MNSWYW